MSEPFDIQRLSADSPWLDSVAAWLLAQWGKAEKDTPESAREQCRAHCGDQGVPSVFVALVEGVAVGTASLVPVDMDSRPELGPWLASVYVVPEWRGQGIASALVRRVEAEAWADGVDTLYLFTPDQQPLYRRLGWQDHEDYHWHGDAVTIMTRQCKPSAQ